MQTLYDSATVTQAAPDAKPRPRRWARRIVAGLIALVLAAWVAEHTILPPLAKRLAVGAISRHWAGPVEISKARFYLDDGLHLDDLVLLDDDGRRWLSAGKVRAEISLWPLGQLTGLRFDEVDLHVHAGQRPPYRRGQEPPGNLQQLEMDNLRLHLIEAGLEPISLEPLSLRAFRQGQDFSFTLSATQPSPNGITAAGQVNPETTQVQAWVVANHQIRVTRSQDVAVELEVPFVKRVEGELTGMITLQGALSDPDNLWPQGQVVIAGVRVYGEHGLVAQDISATVDFDRQNHQLISRDIRGTIARGTFQGQFLLQRRGEQWLYRLRADGRDMQLDQLSQAFTGEPGGRRGVVQARIAGTGDTRERSAFRARGWVFINDAQLLDVPFFSRLFNLIGIRAFNPASLSDLESLFTMEDYLITLQTGRLSNRLAAIEAQPGGTINLQTKQLNMDVVGVPLAEVNRLLGRIPVINWFVNLREQLTQVHIEGPWDAPPVRLLSVRPVANITEGTMNFFQDVAQTGGELGGGLIRGVTDIFERLGVE